MIELTEKDIDRFYDKILFPTVEGTCWIWTACRNQKGYGQFGINGKMKSAHRVAWQIFRDEPLVEGLVLDHMCFCRHCVNPAHLRQVTSAENTANMSEEGKAAKIESDRGENNGKAKLKEQDVVYILQALQEGVTCADLARTFNVGRQSISLIKHGRNWKHIHRPSTNTSSLNINNDENNKPRRS